MEYQLFNSGEIVGGQKLSAGNAVTRKELDDLSNTEEVMALEEEFLDTVIFDNNLSDTARLMLITLHARTAKPGDGAVLIKETALAKQRNVSTKTIKRAVKSCIERNYLVPIPHNKQKPSTKGKYYTLQLPG